MPAHFGVRRDQEGGPSSGNKTDSGNQKLRRVIASVAAENRNTQPVSSKRFDSDVRSLYGNENQEVCPGQTPGCFQLGKSALDLACFFVSGQAGHLLEA